MILCVCQMPLPCWSFSFERKRKFRRKLLMTYVAARAEDDKLKESYFLSADDKCKRRA